MVFGAKCGDRCDDFGVSIGVIRAPVLDCSPQVRIVSIMELLIFWD